MKTTFLFTPAPPIEGKRTTTVCLVTSVFALLALHGNILGSMERYRYVQYSLLFFSLPFSPLHADRPYKPCRFTEMFLFPLLFQQRNRRRLREREHFRRCLPPFSFLRTRSKVPGFLGAFPLGSPPPGSSFPPLSYCFGADLDDP